MARVLVRNGIQAVGEGLTSTVIIGKKSLLQAVQFEGRFQEVAQKYVGDGASWSQMLSRVTNAGRFPLHYQLAHLIAISDTASRGNTPTNSQQLFREMRSINYPEDVRNVQIVLFAEYPDVLAQVAAVAKTFYKFTRKTTGNEERNVFIDVVCDMLTNADATFLTDLSESVREAARLIDTPANILTTDVLVEEALHVAKSLGCKTTLYRGEQLLEAGFGGIYHVGKAGPTPPAFVVLSHEVPESTETIALVGKGVVYDTGGLQIKGKTGMPNMKRDMGGAAGMLEAFAALVKNGFSQTIHVCLCIVENNVSPIANKPDDVITMLSGKSVEINNTDAEGRLILADGVYYAREYLKATTIFDMATLTGAQAYMTGRMHGAAMTNDDELEAAIIKAGKKSGDLVAPMLFAPDLFYPDLKSPIADMRNSNLGKMEGPPSAVAGLFIGAHIEFGEGLRWLHLDIAAPAECGDRGTGYGPALFTTLLGQHTNVPLLRQ
ncbi:unnamed protein product [Caenorhabditis brenneri]